MANWVLFVISPMEEGPQSDTGIRKFDEIVTIEQLKIRGILIMDHSISSER